MTGDRKRSAIQSKSDLIDIVSKLSKQSVLAKVALFDIMRRNDTLSTELIYQLLVNDAIDRITLLERQARRVEAAGERLLEHENIINHWSYGSCWTDLGEGLHAVELSRRDLEKMSRTYLKEGIAILKGHLTLIGRLCIEYDELTEMVVIMEAALQPFAEE